MNVLLQRSSCADVLMRRVLSVLLLTMCSAQVLSAQDIGRDLQSTDGFELHQNYPNPFSRETTIPFTLGDEIFAEGRSAVVSLSIFNLLRQVVAHPVALGHASGQGIELIGLEYLQAGRYEAFWDGNDTSGRQVAPGLYFMQLVVNGMTFRPIRIKVER